MLDHNRLSRLLFCKPSLIIIVITVFVLLTSCGGKSTPQPTGRFTKDTTLDKGAYTFETLTISDNVTVTLEQDTTITISGDTEIDGTLSSDCKDIALRGKGNLRLDGLVENTCADSTAEASSIKLIIEGDITIGSSSDREQIAIETDGELVIAETATENLDLAPISETQNLHKLPFQSGNSGLKPTQGPSTIVNFTMVARDGRLVKSGNVIIGAAFLTKDGDNAQAKNQDPSCDNSSAKGQGAESVRIAARGGTLTFADNVVVKAGDGGKGGDCTATSQDPNTEAVATAGTGGKGASILIGGQNIVFGQNVRLIIGSGGPGGDATATGAAGTPCKDGGSARATAGEGGGPGGFGYIIEQPGSITGAPSEEGANGGKGGNATATAGSGGDCQDGDGGSGGAAIATGGPGGKGARGNTFPVKAGEHVSGDGGNATANGGKGGNGSSPCSNDPSIGNGGTGGAATATAGTPGNAGQNGVGNPGTTAGKAGDGGKGGADQTKAGSGGAAGPGNGVPAGSEGEDGKPCPGEVVLINARSAVAVAVRQGLDGPWVVITGEGDKYIVNLPPETFFIYALACKDSLAARNLLFVHYVLTEEVPEEINAPCPETGPDTVEVKVEGATPGNLVNVAYPGPVQPQLIQAPSANFSYLFEGVFADAEGSVLATELGPVNGQWVAQKAIQSKSPLKLDTEARGLFETTVDLVNEVLEGTTIVQGVNWEDHSQNPPTSVALGVRQDTENLTYGAFSETLQDSFFYKAFFGVTSENGARTGEVSVYHKNAEILNEEANLSDVLDLKTIASSKDGKVVIEVESDDEEDIDYSYIVTVRSDTGLVQTTFITRQAAEQLVEQAAEIDATIDALGDIDDVLEDFDFSDKLIEYSIIVLSTNNPEYGNAKFFGSNGTPPEALRESIKKLTCNQENPPALDVDCLNVEESTNGDALLSFVDETVIPLLF